eukprot:scaffold1102_cov395-Prasinococcus_capsulatus_cf.AAC.6
MARERRPRRWVERTASPVEWCESACRAASPGARETGAVPRSPTEHGARSGPLAATPPRVTAGCHVCSTVAPLGGRAPKVPSAVQSPTPAGPSLRAESCPDQARDEPFPGQAGVGGGRAGGGRARPLCRGRGEVASRRFPRLTQTRPDRSNHASGEAQKKTKKKKRRKERRRDEGAGGRGLAGLRTPRWRGKRRAAGRAPRRQGTNATPRFEGESAQPTSTIAPTRVPRRRQRDGPHT